MKRKVMNGLYKMKWVALVLSVFSVGQSAPVDNCESLLKPITISYTEVSIQKKKKSFRENLLTEQVTTAGKCCKFVMHAHFFPTVLCGSDAGQVAVCWWDL